MNILPPEIIALAVKGGYILPETYEILHDDKGKMGYDSPYSIDFERVFNNVPITVIICDPDFWFAIGRMKGWRTDHVPELVGSAKKFSMPEQFWKAQVFFDLILKKDQEGIARFWGEILS